MKKIILMICVIMLACQNSWGRTKWDEAIDCSHEGEINFRTYYDAIDNNEFEDQFVTDAWFDLKNRIDIKEKNIGIQLDVKGRAETFVGGDTDTQIDLILDEAYVVYDQEGYRITVGQQIVTWGKLDDIVVLDRINPQDFKRFVLDDKQERKIPLGMVKVDFFQDEWQIEALYIPLFRSSDQHYFDNDWATFTRIKEGVVRGNYAEATKTIVKGIMVQERDVLTDRSLDNGQGALRFRGRVSEIDFSVYYMNLLHNIPTLKERSSAGNTLKQFLFSPTDDNLTTLVAAAPGTDDLVLEREHPRVNIFGLDWETVIGAYGFRGEVAYVHDQAFLREDYSYTEQDVLSVGVGVDHTFENNVYVDFQIVEDLIMDYEGLFAQEESSHQLSGTLSKDFMYGDLVFEFDWAARPSYGDWMMNPEIEYKAPYNIKISLGAFIFSGDPTTVFGAYSTQDLYYLKLNYSF